MSRGGIDADLFYAKLLTVGRLGQPKKTTNKGDKMKNVIAVSMLALCVAPMVAQATPVSSVPEPSTIFAGAALLVPFGIGAARSLWKNRRK